MSAAGFEESVIVLDPRNRPFFWIGLVLVGGMLLSVLLYTASVFSERREPHSGLSPATQNMVRTTALQRDVESLKGQMNMLITGAMEAKIQRLEDSLKSGIISRTDLSTVQALKDDLKVLKAYSVRSVSETFGPAEGSGSLSGGAAAYSDELQHEIGRIRGWFYFSIASWGIAIVLFAGSWFTNYHRLRQIRSERLFRHQMLGKPKSEIY